MSKALTVTRTNSSLLKQTAASAWAPGTLHWGNHAKRNAEIRDMD